VTGVRRLGRAAGMTGRAARRRASATLPGRPGQRLSTGDLFTGKGGGCGRRCRRRVRAQAWRRGRIHRMRRPTAIAVGDEPASSGGQHDLANSDLTGSPGREPIARGIVLPGRSRPTAAIAPRCVGTAGDDRDSRSTALKLHGWRTGSASRQELRRPCTSDGPNPDSGSAVFRMIGRRQGAGKVRGAARGAVTSSGDGSGRCASECSAR
jgi:hypothetical protein